MSVVAAAVTTSAQRVEMERHSAVRLAADLLWHRRADLPTEVVHRHVVALLLDSVHKQERWSR